MAKKRTVNSRNGSKTSVQDVYILWRDITSVQSIVRWSMVQVVYKNIVQIYVQVWYSRVRGGSAGIYSLARATFCFCTVSFVHMFTSSNGLSVGLVRSERTREKRRCVHCVWRGCTTLSVRPACLQWVTVWELTLQIRKVSQQCRYWESKIDRLWFREKGLTRIEHNNGGATGASRRHFTSSPDYALFDISVQRKEKIR